MPAALFPRLALGLTLVAGAAAADTDIQLSTDDARAELAGVQDVDLSVSFDGDPGCDLSEARVRAAVTERMVAAGMRIDVTSLLVMRVSVNVLYAKSSDLCIAQRSVITTLYSAYDGAGREPTHGHVVVRIDEGLSTSDPKKTDFILKSIADGMKGTIDLWREANAGQDFVRPVATAPQAGPTSPVLETVSVRTVQQRLADLGLFRGTIDGNSGPTTRLAIQRFQRTNDLPATGDLDRETVRRLFP